MPKREYVGFHKMNLSLDCFEKAVNKIRMEDKTIKIVQSVLVDGENVESVAVRFSVSTTWVKTSCKRVIDALTLNEQTDITLSVPQALVPCIKKVSDFLIHAYRTGVIEGGK